MAHNAFGGHRRLDKCDLQGPSLLDDILVDVTSDTEPERTLWTSVIADAVNQFIFWGLGRNGTSAQEFWHSVEYLFRVRSDRPETWSAARVVREEVFDDATGQRVNRVVRLDDDVLKFMCLDVLWGMLRFPIDLETFLRHLKAERRVLLQRNWSQIRAYLHLQLTYAECAETLTCPASPDELTDLIHSVRTRLAVAA